MQVICSDTNIWIDFRNLSRLDWPFLLEHTYMISRMALDDEILSPPDQATRLLRLGLQAVELSDDELLDALMYADKYPKLSTYDAIALTIAKSRCIILLTGDKALRTAARAEGVEPRGLLWIIDQLLELKCISIDEYRKCAQDLFNSLGNPYRYPKQELLNRINR